MLHFQEIVLSKWISAMGKPFVQDFLTTYLSTNVIISIHLQVVTYLPHLLLAGIVELRIELFKHFCRHFASVL